MLKDYTGAKPEKVLKEVFGYSSFKLLQKEIINNVLNKKDTLAIMPTGGGKSLCYQIPALIFEGLTVVVSPLISLMQDQVDTLLGVGFNAVFLNSSLDWENYLESMNAIRRGEIKILYVSPEGLSSSKIRELLHEVKVSCITIDEAHCVSEWGHDFRPEFLEIASVRRQFPSAVCLALTATATDDVRNDIIKNLALKEPSILISSFNRENIYLEVKQKKDGLAQCVECIRDFPGESGIIYCFSRKQVDNLTENLLKLGYSVLNYHAGLSDDERKMHQNMFIRDQVQIMVATLAFGMGIDKPNVRFVIHYDLPKSLEQYYQEIGRAGRDGLKSKALLLYSSSDIFKIRHFFDESTDSQKSENLLNSMVNFATSRFCRRKLLLSYFGEHYDKTRNIEDSTFGGDFCCDVCSFGDKEDVDMTIPCQKLMSCIIRTDSHFGSAYVVDVLLGSRNKRILENSHNMISTWGIGTELNKEGWFELISLLLQKKYIVKSCEYGVLKLTREGLNILKNRDRIKLPFDLESFKNRSDTVRKEKSNGSEESQKSLYATENFIPKKRASAGANGSVLFPKPSRTSKKSSVKKIIMNFIPTDEEKSCINLLKKWRKKKAQEMNVPPYVIFGDKTLNEIVTKRPKTIDELMDCYGIGENKAQNFGAQIISVLKES
ncbi:RecQ family ATP-dependent DNA helicase [Treponema pectinovorum]|uniref:RecQ family ATP-dependent DNA helicase n=1 Tax=Treponema pectinovorum TaxID=164 RepID=UPI0011F2F71F|nr:ATP-dependent DNA helicase RecQ [Treponema pectinovorum]